MARIVSSDLAVPDRPGTTVTRLTGHRPVVLNLFISLRPGQWTKNLLVFAALVFAVRLFDPASVLVSLEAFAIFCALSGVVYLVNDVVDRETDRQHPLKCQRPIPSGALPVPLAVGVAVALGGASLAAAFLLGWRFGTISAGYLALMLLYSGSLKQIVILDVLAISIGFVLRAAAGAAAIDVVISHWLFACTILLALFISLAKRRHELVLLASDAPTHRPILGEYSSYLLDQMIAIVAASTLIAYIFYTFSPETVEKFGTSWLGLTIPFPLYGIFRYLYLVHRRDGGGSPAELLLNDRPLLVCVTLWVLTVVAIVYAPLRF
jgi:4-hydroxybenzoate polyprenyltransferase